MRRVYAREDVCMGCRLCEVYCLVEHSRSRDIITAFRREEPRAVSRVQVLEEGAVSFAVQCRHCEDAPCVTACIAGAIARRADRVVTLDRDRCVGCWTCVLVCPYGAVVRDGNVSARCDLCPDRERPACVEMCPNEALVYAEGGEWR